MLLEGAEREQNPLPWRFPGHKIPFKGGLLILFDTPEVSRDGVGYPIRLWGCSCGSWSILLCFHCHKRGEKSPNCGSLCSQSTLTPTEAAGCLPASHINPTGMGWDFLGGGHHSECVGWLQAGAVPTPVDTLGMQGDHQPRKMSQRAAGN